MMHNMGWWCLGFILLICICKSKSKPKRRGKQRDYLQYATVDEIDEIMCRLDEIEERLG
jgi:hypothetical protein